ncbi:hypothetical protein M407DRAFT_245914 [Tulasnella calospora MUT 4182]|uniref:Uncharacterized protein n=1 Tax=Tulasnella calospora MUT 4182 TaxID=1051891 RepID=A0A0C3LFH2_9AGAM|nr:hypothetical protein M407DRAFT_245914 [Tulasnella calospora MUT 4182]
MPMRVSKGRVGWHDWPAARRSAGSRAGKSRWPSSPPKVQVFQEALLVVIRDMQASFGCVGSGVAWARVGQGARAGEKVESN